ncbi:MAG: DUF58 domain-containing protein [Lachnospiraceae bacterium]|nr:DUF58 domain-containing protein [Lachnospiraceae bacterium]
MRRNRIIYYLLCAAALAFASFYGGPVSYTILFGLILVTPVSYAYLLAVYSFFRIYQSATGKHIVAYEPVPYYFVLQNEYLLNFCHIRPKMYSTFSYIENMDEDREYELLPHENARYDTKLICRYRGEYKVGIKSITITDYLKLFSITYHVHEPISVVVAPRITELRYLRTGYDPIRNSYKESSRMKQFPDTVVRDYIPGDPPKSIHHKLSARTGSLKSRLYYGEERQGISIWLDTHRISDDEYVYIPVENKCLEIVLAIANYFSALSVTSTLKYYRPAGESLKGSGAQNGNSGLYEVKCGTRRDMEGFHSQVAAVPFRTGDDRGRAIKLMANDCDFSNSLVAFLVITETGRELNETLNELSMAGASCVIYYVSYEPDVSGIISLQDQIIVPVHPEDDLTAVM